MHLFNRDKLRLFFLTVVLSLWPFFAQAQTLRILACGLLHPAKYGKPQILSQSVKQYLGPVKQCENDTQDALWCASFCSNVFKDRSNGFFQRVLKSYKSEFDGTIRINPKEVYEIYNRSNTYIQRRCVRDERGPKEKLEETVAKNLRPEQWVRLYMENFESQSPKTILKLFGNVLLGAVSAWLILSNPALAVPKACPTIIVPAMPNDASNVHNKMSACADLETLGPQDIEELGKEVAQFCLPLGDSKGYACIMPDGDYVTVEYDIYQNVITVNPGGENS